MSYYQQEYQHTWESIDNIVEAKVDYVLGYIKQGWEPSLITFMFDQISGGYDAVLQDMEDEILRVYNRVVKYDLKYPGTEKNKERRPIWISCPDFPIPRGKKSRLRDIIINNGLHFHTFALRPPWSNMLVSLDNHFLDHQSSYIRQNYEERRYHPLRKIHCIPITQDPGYVMKYVLKWVLRGKVDPGQIFSLPQSRSEFKNLPTDPRKLTGGGAF